MAANTAPIFPLTPYFEALLLGTTAGGPCTTRLPTVLASCVAAKIYAFGTVAPAAGRRIDRIDVKASASAIGGATVAGLVGIWIANATTAYLYDEIVVTAVTPSATVASFNTFKLYNNLVLPSGFQLYVSTTIQGADAAHALVVEASGGDYQ
jgi:hypothetical protein